MNPTERHALADAQAALLDAMVAAAKAIATISTLIVADKRSETRAAEPPVPVWSCPSCGIGPTDLFHAPACTLGRSDRTMTEAERAVALRPKPGPPKERP